MNRSKYFLYIEEKLGSLCFRIIQRGKLNILDLHIHSENFYLEFLNLLFGFKLSNLNTVLQNVESIDLIDSLNKIILQVSATATKAKVQGSLDKLCPQNYPGYTFQFVAIAGEADALKKSTYKPPNGISFSPIRDIYDSKRILSFILNLDIVKQKEIYSFIKNELGNEIDFVRLDTNLAQIINILSQEDWSQKDSKSVINSFEIDRKITFNQLTLSRPIIEDYVIHFRRVDKKYCEFDQAGMNKSISILSIIKKDYLLSKKENIGDDLFFSVIEKVRNRVVKSSNFQPIPEDELDLVINILVVDAFVRCQIFENPQGYNHATS